MEGRVERLRVIERACGTRRQWTAAQKVTIIQECLEGRGSVAAVALRHGIRASLIFKWRRAYQEGRLQTKAGPKPEGKRKPKPQAAFTQAVIVAEAEEGPSIGGIPSADCRDAAMEVIALSGRRVVVGPAVDGAALARVLAVLEGA